MVEERILLVDDETNVLSALERRLRSRFRIDTSSHPLEALEKVKAVGPYAVVVSDLRMPEMNGTQLLRKIKELSPETVRIMLTGYADLDTAMEAVNEGNVFRFLTKPCPAEVLERTIGAGLEQYRLVRAERELLEQTLKGSIRVLTELLCLLHPEAFERSHRVTRLAAQVARVMELKEIWKVETAALLSQIGWVTLPEQLLEKLKEETQLSGEEQRLFERHPFVASNLIAHIPRLGEIAEIISLQEKRFDGSGFPEGPLIGEDIPVEARILKAILDFDLLTQKGQTREQALETLRSRTGWYDPTVLAALDAVLNASNKYVVKALALAELTPGMILGEDVKSKEGTLLLAKGRHITQPILERLGAVARAYGLEEPLRVLVPMEWVLQGEATPCSPPWTSTKAL
ncbi:MAG: HD domain-containing phosphohydrolase [bacterium]